MDLDAHRVPDVEDLEALGKGYEDDELPSEPSSSYYADDLTIIAAYEEPAYPPKITPLASGELVGAPHITASSVKQPEPNSEDEYVVDDSIFENYVEDVPVLPKREVSSTITNPLKRTREPFEETPDIRSAKHVKTSHPVHVAAPEPDGELYHHNAHIIAHCPKIEALMRRFKLARGVRYELARLISRKKLEQNRITESSVKQLRGSNEEAVPKIARVFLSPFTDGDHAVPNDTAFAKEFATHSPWKELDIEDAALSKGPYEGLGNNPAMPNWYGGRVQFRAHLQIENKEGKNRSLKVTLDEVSLGTSCRFTRRFGSWSFIRVKIPDEVYYNKAYNMLSYFSRPFIIWDSVFRACYAKGDNVFLYMTNEISTSSLQTIEGRLSLEGFIIWHNPLLENRNQLMTKWSSRMVLGFSNSVPGPRLEEGSILPEDDIVSKPEEPMKPSTMTDGCGLSTRKIHHEVLLLLNLPVFPTAFQFRVAGCKGMSLLSDNPEYKDDRKMWVRPSQTKILYPKGIPTDPAMLTIDLLRTTHMRGFGTRLSNDMVINLAENGVPAHIFVDLFKTSLDALVKGLTTWDGPDAMLNLWYTVEKVCGALAQRRSREAGGEARVRGYSNRSPEEMEPCEDDDEDDIAIGSDAPKSVAWWTDQISGCPSPLEDTVLFLLDSGFRPQECPILRDKLKHFTISKIENRIESLRFEIEQSCVAFAVPDPYGVLGENEIQIKSSTRNLKLEDGTTTDIITGDVLIGRNPTKNPCDIRKVKAVEHPLLRNHVDVIVCSVQGWRRLIDFLAGGDYDGDTLVAIWLASIVSSFNNADEKFSEEIETLKESFERDKETVGGFIERTKLWTAEKRTEAMQVYLLGGLCDPSLIGKYSAMHEYATYTLGYDHPTTVELNAKFCTILDSSKNGQRIKQDVLRSDTEKYGRNLPPKWKTEGKKKKAKYSKNELPPTRSLLKPFIMDTLVRAAQKEKTRVMIEMDKVFAESNPCRPDPHLVKPWLDAQAWARRNGKEAELELIEAHVRKVYAEHKKALATSKTGNFSDLRIEKRQDFLRKSSREFHSGPSMDLLPGFVDEALVSRIRASYAYKYDSEQGYKRWSRFPWNVDLRQLCAIKAAALGPYKVVAADFYERFKLVKKN